MTSCCSDAAIDVDPSIDLAVDARAVTVAVDAMLDLGVPMGIRLAETGTLLTWPLRTAAFMELLDHDTQAWVVQRPGCAGLVTRVLLLDPTGELVACIAPVRSSDTLEPPSWRLNLLLGLARAA